MRLNKRSPIWPYLLVLGCLFALSIAAPRGWRHSDPAATDVPQNSQASDGDLQPSVVRPLEHDVGATPATKRIDKELTATWPQREDAAERIADQWRFRGQELSPGGHSSADASADKTAPLPASDPTTGPAFGDQPPPAATQPATSGADQSTLANTIASEIQHAVEPRPQTSSTNDSQQSVGNGASGSSGDKTAGADDPANQPTLATPQGTESVLRAPQPASIEPNTTPQPEHPAPKIAEATVGDLPPTPETSAQLHQPDVVLPPPTDAAPSAPEPSAPSPSADDHAASSAAQPAKPPFTSRSVWPAPESLVKQLNKLAEKSECHDWATAVLEKLSQLNNLDRKQCDQAQTIFDALRQLLPAADQAAMSAPLRATATEIRRAQFAVVRRVDIWEAVANVRRYGAQGGGDGLDTTDILNAIEQYESSHLPTDAQHIAALRTDLAQSSAGYDRELASRMAVLYRNANFRVAISDEMLERFLPDQEPASGKVDEVILGAPVYGNSVTSTRLGVQFAPNPRQWQINLIASGAVDSQTYTTHGPVTFMTHGDASYRATKQIIVDPSGMQIAPAAATVNNNSQLRGMRTNFDSMPLMRAIVRNYAMSQHDQQQGQADHEAEQKIAAKAAGRVNEATDPQLNAAEASLRRKFIDPLEKLGLDPAAIGMSTTDKRIILRSRLAGADQLAANTARPEAFSDTLASVQLHESAINNLLDHLGLGGKTFTLPDLRSWLADRLGRPGAVSQEELPSDVQITFAQYNPLVVRCDGDRVELTIRVAELRQAKRHWRDFEVKATYRPTSSGLTAELEREGSIELGGAYQGKTEVALRGIFSKVLSHERKLNLMPAAIAQDPRLSGLEITQLEITDGWIALAIGHQRVATQTPAAERR